MRCRPRFRKLSQWGMPRVLHAPQEHSSSALTTMCAPSVRNTETSLPSSKPTSWNVFDALSITPSLTSCNMAPFHDSSTIFLASASTVSCSLHVTVASKSPIIASFACMRKSFTFQGHDRDRRRWAILNNGLKSVGRVAIYWVRSNSYRVIMMMLRVLWRGVIYFEWSRPRQAFVCAICSK